MPLLSVLLSDREVLCVVGHARFNHRSLEPFVERADRDPVGTACNCCIPAGVIGSTVIAGYDERILTSRNMCIIITWHNTSRPEFLGVVGGIIGIHLIAETLVHGGHIAVE